VSNGESGDVVPPSITCPVCGRTSWHYMDVREGWCGACRGVTSRPGHPGVPEPPPPGMRWVRLWGGSVDAGRMLSEPLPDRYELVATGEVYVLRGDSYHLEGAPR
jgi:hypothetical protein